MRLSAAWILGLALTALAGGRSGAIAAAPGIDPVGLVWTLPAGWQPATTPLTSLSEPVQRFGAATFALRQARPDRGCSPDTARRQLPADGAIVFLLESRDIAPRDLARLPPRPARFRLPDARAYECLGEGSIVSWAEQGRALSAHVLLGRHAGAARRREVEALLDSLVVQRIPPPPPPAGWATAISGAGDSIRVPPGWSADALRDVKGTPRPRVLFRLRDPSGAVAMRVIEHRRGPGTPRDGFRVRGYRFSVQVTGGEPAAVSGRSLGISGVGRG